MTARRPVLLVPFDRGSAAPWEVMEAADEYADVVFVYPEDSPYRASTLPLVQECAPTLVVSGPQQVVAALADREVRGVATFSDRTLRLAATLGEAFGCDFHTPEVAAGLTDKLLQRRLLSVGSVPTPAVVAPKSPAGILDTTRAVGFPCVVKPRQSCESQHTYRVTDPATARDVVDEAAGVWDAVGGFVVEEMLRGDQRVAGPGWGWYVSVETMVVHGRQHHLAMVGKLPLTHPFRESGDFFPATVPPTDVPVILAGVTEAITALGIRHGCCHTEVMLTADGPRIIEVNGRLGGLIGDVIERATGVSLLELTIASAMNDHSGIAKAESKLAADPYGVSFVLFTYAAPDAPTAGAVHEVRGVPKVRDLPGVTNVVLTARPGDRVDVAMGTGSMVAQVRGLVPDHDSLCRLAPRVTELLQADLKPIVG
ncbi:MAG: ATP-grasp domain-containing protein [Angustibacter sp.]